MKKSFLSLLGLISFVISFAQVTERNILATNYSAAFVKEKLVLKSNYKPYPTTSGEWKKLLSDSTAAMVIANAEKFINFKFEPITATLSLDFVRSGDRERHSEISFAKRNNLMQMIVAESIEDKGRFTEAILNGIWSICEESYWGVPAHISGKGLPDVEEPIVDLFTAETAGVMAMADYFIGAKLDKINPLIRKRIYHETDRRLFTPMMKNGSKYGWMSRVKPVNNWNPWIMSNWMLSTLMLEKNETRRAEMMHASMVGLDAYLNSLGDDGGCDEGPSYWFAAGASVFDCLELLTRATNGAVNVYENDLIKKMSTYIINTHIDKTYFVNFADADPTLTPDGLLLYRLGKAIKDDRLVEFGKWANQQFSFKDVAGSMRMRRIENLLSNATIDKTAANYKPANASWINDVQVMTTRTEKGLFLGAHGGHNAESHNHNDVGDFIIYQKGQPMIIDAGRGNYTARTFSSQRYQLWFTTSAYHNLPLVNGYGQKEGRQFEAKDVSYLSNEKETSVTMNIAAAYPKEAGLNSWIRKVKLNRAKEQVEITETYEMNEVNAPVQEVFMTICDVDLSKKGEVVLKGNAGVALTMKYDASAWNISTELPSTEGMEYKSFKKKWGGNKITRIILTSNTSTQKKGNHKIVFLPN